MSEEPQQQQPPEQQQTISEDLAYFDYDDPNTPIPTDQDGKTTVPLSSQNEVLVPGDTKRKRLIVKNMRTDGVLELIPFVEDVGVSIERYPTELGPQQSGLVELKYLSPTTLTSIPLAGFGFDLVLRQQKPVIG